MKIYEFNTNPFICAYLFNNNKATHPFLTHWLLSIKQPPLKLRRLRWWALALVCVFQRGFYVYISVRTENDVKEGADSSYHLFLLEEKGEVRSSVGRGRKETISHQEVTEYGNIRRSRSLIVVFIPRQSGRESETRKMVDKSCKKKTKKPKALLCTIDGKVKHDFIDMHLMV